MTATWDFDPIHHILRSTFVGKVNDDDLMNHQRMAALLVESLDPLAAIVDLSGANPFEATPGGMRHLAKLPAPMPKVDRPRVVVAPPDHVLGLVRIFQIVGEATRPNLHVVRTMPEAWLIIGVEAAQARFEAVAPHVLHRLSES
ncbi:MAG: hypothetical protein WAN10_00150 [Candidatus Acidiferrales bacterium]